MRGKKDGPSPDVVLKHLEVPIFECNSEGAIRYANQALAQLVQVDIDDRGRIAASSRPTVQSLFGFVDLKESHIWHDSKGKIWSVDLRRTRDGWIGWMSLFEDSWRQALDGANAPILVTDRDRRIKMINRSFELLTGYPLRDLQDMDIMKLLLADDRERFMPAIINALRGNSTSSIEIRIPKKQENTNVRIALSTAAIKNGYGEIEGVVAVGQDLTELRQLQQQVIHSEKLATLGQLAAGVAHELNNPLTSISVYSEYLLKKMEDSGSDEADLTKIRRICQGAERILKFSRDLTAYARPNGEEPRLIDPRDLVGRAVVFCEHLVDSVEVSVTTEFDDDLPPIYGVEGHIQQVLVNLITNACDAMTKGEGSLRIEVRNLGERIRLTVADDGPGVPEADRERIFEPFFTTKAEGKGTGLGLSIVRNIITNHNGTISVEETPGGGATFVIELFAG